METGYNDISQIKPPPDRDVLDDSQENTDRQTGKYMRR
jgi:hypothetical protein